ncbi:hypothetical protein BGZ60DRAFT_158238 [Tricladium varicosporioides]|nr:hypothetical protein BGZ60DRAFT_158238 [Hymenoscyphus varicosporioides]
MGDRTLDKSSSYVEAQSPKHDRSHPFSPATLKPQLKFPDKRLIVCCDGTWNASDVNGQPLTNVARIARCISDVDDWTPPEQRGTSERNYIQIVHYQPGVGNGTGWAANVWDGVTGRGLDKSIRAAYQFICLNWSSKSDEIVLIGFSRGAFTVRCVAQFIQEVGLLTKSGVRHLPKLFELWKTREVGEDSPSATLLRQKCEELKKWGELVEEEVKIEACAVWDTVSAVAHIPLLSRPKYRTVGKEIPKNVKFAVQALALGERRSQFEPMVWDQPVNGNDQILKQCWFAGNHSDVGGGNKEVTHSNITLAWMVGQLTDKIQFNQDNLWAITTTRSWSKPTPSDKIEESMKDDVKKCRVVAESPISRSL